MKLAALYYHHIFGVVFLSVNPQIKASLQPHLFLVSAWVKCIEELTEEDMPVVKRRCPERLI